MAPTDERLDEHGKRLDTHDERLNIHAARFDRLNLIIEGDEKAGVPGLVQGVKELSTNVKDLLSWRDDLILYWRTIQIVMRWTLILLSVIGAGVWWPWLKPYVDLIVKYLGG